MKYKEQALNKIGRIENQIRALEVAINRSSSLGEIVAAIENVKELVRSLHDTISIEHDEWN
jgi:DNA-binding FrmR family transcriptional regulator